MRITLTLIAPLAGLVSLTVFGCTGQIAGSGSIGSNETGTEPGGTDPGAPGTAVDPLANAPSIDPNAPLPPPAPAAPSVAPTPLVRLSAAELRNTLIDLFGADVVQDFPFPAVDGPSLQAPINSVDAVGVFTLAETIAEKAYKTSKVMVCVPGALSAAACNDRIVRSIGKRVFRRPLTDTEAARFVQTAGTAKTFDEGVRILLAAMLASPKFLYRAGRPDESAKPDSIRALDGWEIASRLSYALTQSMPDDELFAAAESGTLAGTDGLRTQTRRLLAGPRAHAVVAGFAGWWLRLARAENTFRDPKLFPSFKDGMNRQWIDETRTFVERVVLDGPGTLGELLTAPYTYAPAELAAIYGGSADATGRVSLPADRRSGLLTQAGLLGPPADNERTAAIHRGAYIHREILCSPLPQPPANVPPIPVADPAASLRNQIEVATGAGTCAACHHTFNGFGFALGNFDAIGQWTDKDDNGKPVDTAVALTSPADLEGVAVDGPVALGRALAKSAALRDCVVDKWFEFMTGRPFDPEQGDAYSRLRAEYEFEVGDRDVKELLVSLVASDSFRYLRVPSP